MEEKSRKGGGVVKEGGGGEVKERFVERWKKAEFEVFDR